MTADLKVQMVPDVEHQTDRSLVHRKILDRFVVAVGDIHIVFAEDGYDRKRIELHAERNGIETGIVVVTDSEAVAAVHVEEKRSRIDLAEVHRRGSGDAEDRVVRSERITVHLPKVDVVRFADPGTALRGVRRREVRSENKRNVKELVLGKRCAEFQRRAEVSQVSLLGRIRILEFQLVVIDREHDSDIHDFKHAERHAEIAAEPHELVQFIILKLTIVHVTVEHVVFENTGIVRNIAQEGDAQLTVLHRLRRVGFVETELPVLVKGLVRKGERNR